MNKGTILAIVGAVAVMGGAGLMGLSTDKTDPVDIGNTDPVAVVEEARVDLRPALLTATCTPEPVPPPNLVYCWAWECLGHGDEDCAWRRGFVPPGCADAERMVSVEVPDIKVSVKGEPVAVEGQATHPVDLPTCLALDQDGVCPSVDRTWVEARDAYRAATAARAAERAKCPGGVQAAPSGHGCLCMAAALEARVEGEAQAVSDLAPAERLNLVVCCDRERARVLRLPASEQAGKDCRVIGQPVTDFTMGDYPTDFSRLMTTACAPCPGPGGQYCPDCLCQPGGCAAACR